MMPSIEKIRMEDFMEFMLNFDKEKFKTQRFGQAFLNMFYPSVHDPDVFHQTDRKLAISDIITKYVNI